MDCELCHRTVDCVHQPQTKSRGRACEERQVVRCSKAHCRRWRRRTHENVDCSVTWGHTTLHCVAVSSCVSSACCSPVTGQFWSTGSLCPDANPPQRQKATFLFPNGHQPITPPLYFPYFTSPSLSADLRFSFLFLLLVFPTRLTSKNRATAHGECCKLSRRGLRGGALVANALLRILAFSAF